MLEDNIKTLSHLVTQRTPVEEPTHEKQQIGLPELPNELLLPILDGLDDKDLLSLIFLCRRLHLLALPMYLARIQVLKSDSPSTDRIILGADLFVPALCLLLRSLCISSVKYFECQVPGFNAPVLTHVRKIRRFVSKLTSVDEVSLEFNLQYTRQPQLKLVDWSTAFGQLLETLYNKSCKTFTIRHAEKAAEAFISRGTNPFTSTKAKPKGSLPRTLSFFRSLRPSITSKREAALDTNPIKFARAILPIHALNGSPVTAISLDYIQIGPEPWAANLSSASFPSLTNLRISCTSIAIVDIIKFLARHPSIITLDLSWVSPARKRPGPRPPRSILPNVKTMLADRHIVALLLTANLPSLQSITMPLTFIFTKYVSQMADVNQLLSDLEKRKDDIALNLIVSMEFDAGDEVLSSAATAIVTDACVVGGKWQSHVKTIEFNVGVQHRAFSEGAIRFIPLWFGRHFSALEHVSMGYTCDSFQCPYHSIALESHQTLTKMLRSACPLIKSITISGLTYE